MAQAVLTGGGFVNGRRPVSQWSRECDRGQDQRNHRGVRRQAGKGFREHEFYPGVQRGPARDQSGPDGAVFLFHRWREPEQVGVPVSGRAREIRIVSID